jgi:hypothetical protein
MEISAKTKEHPEAVVVNYDIPDTLNDLVGKFGEGVIASNAKGALVISLQSFMRRHLDKGQAELQKLVDTWKPDVRSAAGPKKSAFEKVQDALGGLTPEQRVELIKALKAKA